MTKLLFGINEARGEPPRLITPKQRTEFYLIDKNDFPKGKPFKLINQKISTNCKKESWERC